MKIRRYKGYKKAMDAFSSCDLPQLLCGVEVQRHLFHVQHEWDSWEMLFWRLLDGRITQEGVAVWKCNEGCFPPDKPDLEIAMPWREGDFNANIKDIVEVMSEELD
jgi:hypothetical protein